MIKKRLSGTAPERARAESDLKKLDLVFIAARANIPTKDAVNFCRRVGEKGEEPRPLVVGFHDETTKKKLLRVTKNLMNSQLSHVTIAPDLTKLQRKADDDLKTEAAERNKQLTAEDRSKNLQWLVVGQRGVRRLIKGVKQFQTQDNTRQQHKRKAEDRNSPPDSRKRGKQALIEKVRLDRQKALEKSGVPLLPGPMLLPRKEGVVDVEEEETEWEDNKEGMDEEDLEEEAAGGAVPTAH